MIYSDCADLLSWLPKDERGYFMWSAGKFAFPPEAGAAERYFETYAARSSSQPMTALTDDGIPCGHFLLRRIDYEKNEARLGFIIVDPALRGKGTGRKMLALARKYAFEILGLKRLTLAVFDDNISAKACYLKAGFVLTGKTEEYEQNGRSLTASEMETTA